jgi:hypothetical protein
MVFTNALGTVDSRPENLLLGPLPTGNDYTESISLDSISTLSILPNNVITTSISLDGVSAAGESNVIDFNTNLTLLVTASISEQSSTQEFNEVVSLNAIAAISATGGRTFSNSVTLSATQFISTVTSAFDFTAELGTNKSLPGRILLGKDASISFIRPATNRLILTQQAVGIRARTGSATNTISFVSSATFSANRIFPASNLLALTQQASYVINKQKSVSNVIEFQAFAIGTLGEPAFSRLILNQSAISQVNRSALARNTLVLNQSARLPAITSGHNTLSLTQAATYNIVKNLLATNNIVFVGAAGRETKQYAVNSFTLIQNATFILSHGARNNLVFNQAASYIRVRNARAGNIIKFNQTASRTGVINVSASNFIRFYNGSLKNLNHVDIQIPEASGIIINPNKPTLLILKTSDAVITLPGPIFGDVIGNLNNIIIQKSMNDTTYSYVKRTKTQKLQYNFVLSRRKGLELRKFIQNNCAKLITIIDWKGETWKAYLTTNPVQLEPKERWANCDPGDSEKINVGLEFEGLRIS